MPDNNNNNNNNNNNDVAVERDLITSEDVEAVVSGNQQALIEQLERARQVALEQLEASKNAPAHSNVRPVKTQQELEEELRKREAELNAAKVAAGMQLPPSVQKQYNSNLNMQQIQMDKRHAQVEADIQSRVTPIGGVLHFQPANVTPQVVSSNQVNAIQNANSTKLSKAQLKEQQKLQQKLYKEQKEAARKKAEAQAVVQKNMSKEEKRKAKELRKANSNAKYVMTIILFVGLFALVYFLPYISNYISAMKAEKEAEKAQIITTGNLECELKKYDKLFDYEYSSVFAFKDSKLTKLTYKETTKGDKSTDEVELNAMKNNCLLLKQEVSSQDGIVVRCSLSNGVNINEQVFNYDILDVEKVTTSYLEAGGMYPKYSYQEDIDKIEKEMKAAGYTCLRTK